LHKKNANGIKQYSRALYRAATNKAEAVGVSFEAAQYAFMSDAGEALAQMSARFAKGKTPLAELVRQRQNLLDRRRSEDKRLLQASARVDFDAAGKVDLATGNALRASIAEIDASLDKLDATLATSFPDYAEFTSPKPLSIGEVQALLTPTEALILFLDIPEIKPLAGETLVWVITREASVQRSVALDSRQLAAQVAALRCGLDAALWQNTADRAKCEGLLQAPHQNAQQGLLPFDLGRAHDMYRDLLGPDLALIKDKHLLIVPSGALSQLPFGVLVTEPPASAFPATFAEYAAAAWLGTQQPLSVLPSVGSLKALRQFARSAGGKSRYLGVGNPLLDGHQADPVSDPIERRKAIAARDRQRCVKPMSIGVTHAASRRPVSFGKLFQGEHADIEQIRAATPLPETAHEVCAVGNRLDAKEADILLGSRARESILKDMSESGRLADYRILHFATHGALAGEIRNAAEPGLILTPPDRNASGRPSPERDDAYLAASEIATLKLDADWVILSACNTAGGAGENTEALSGLARAFFHAGARALLVSHWAVDSDATVTLVSGTVDALAQGGQPTRAEALRQSIRMLIQTGQHRVHPAYWAPFVLVGNDAPAATQDGVAVTVPFPSRAPSQRRSNGRLGGKAPATVKPKVSAWEYEVFLPR
jgi:CHAT domain-containing protein